MRNSKNLNHKGLRRYEELHNIGVVFFFTKNTEAMRAFLLERVYIYNKEKVNFGLIKFGLFKKNGF